MKILITSKSFGKNNKDALKMLEDNGFTLVYGSRPTMSAQEISREIKGIDILVVGNDTIDREVLDAADQLKLIHMHGTGLDGIDVKYAAEKGIRVLNAPGANSNAVAELTIGLMLAAGRDMIRHSINLRKGLWERQAGAEISGSTICIFGLGHIGKRIVQLLKGFRVKVLALDPAADALWARQNDVELSEDAERLFREADFLILALPLLENTRHLVDERALSLMKPTAFIINTARGGLIDEKAVAQAVREKRIAGAGIDAFSIEPPPENSPLRFEGITITPHLAATSIQSSARVSGIVAENIITMMREWQDQK